MGGYGDERRRDYYDERRRDDRYGRYDERGPPPGVGRADDTSRGSDGWFAPAAAATRARDPDERPARAPRRGVGVRRVARGAAAARAANAADAAAISRPRADRARERV